MKDPFRASFEQKRVKFDASANKEPKINEDFQPSIRPKLVVMELSEMQRRKRATQLLQSNEFKSALGDIVDVNGTLTPLVKNLLEQLNIDPNFTPSTTPIAVQRTSPFDCEEFRIRCDAAVLTRIFGDNNWFWTSCRHNLLSMRMSNNSGILVSPLDSNYEEISAADFIQIPYSYCVETIKTNCHLDSISVQWFHSIFHARDDVSCIVFIATSEVQAVSSTKCGLLPVNKEACILGSPSYLTSNELSDIETSLGPKNKILFIRNVGALVCGSNIAELHELTYCLIQAAQCQISATHVSGNDLSKIILIPDDLAQKVKESTESHDKSQKWSFGELALEAAIRKLDSKGCRTGYRYKNPFIRAPIKTP